MRILTSSYTMDRSGVPTYTVTMVRELARRGHTVAVYSPKGGPLAKQVPLVVTAPLDFEQPDVIVAQQNKCAKALAEAYPSVPMVYSVHGVLPPTEQIPRNIRVDRWTVIHQQAFDHILRQYVPAARVSILRDFIDLERFAPRTPLQAETPRVLFISNYKKWKQYYRLSAACRRLGWPLTCIGSPYGRSRDVATDINNADIVVSWARGILEAMACGRAVVSYDNELGDGYITPQNYHESRERNFSGYECRHEFTIEQLQAELRKYDPAHGVINRNLVARYHDVVEGVSQLLDVIDAAMADRRETPIGSPS